MESYPDPHVNSADRGDASYYSSSSNAIAQLHDEGMLNMAHNIPSSMHGGGGLSDQQDSRSHNQMNQSFQSPSQIPHHLNNQVHLQAGQSPMAQMGMHYGAPEGSSSARKRTKVSRACDECRRKKVKCDGTSEEEACSNCRRSNAECLFSRVPQKRGPSKGYINALEKRVRALEHTSQDTMYMENAITDQPPVGDGMPSNPRTDFESRKRSFSNTNSAGELASPFQPRPLAPAWHPNQPLFSQNTAPEPSQQSSHSLSNEELAFPRPSYSSHGPFSDNNPTQLQHSSMPTSSRQSNNYTENNNLSALEALAAGAQDLARPDESAIDGYYQYIHPSLPFLSDSKQAVLSSAGICPPLLAEAFYEALRGASASISPPELSQYEPKYGQKAAELLNIYELGEPSRNFQAKLVHVQASMLMAIEAQSRTFNPTARQTGGSLSRWISLAVNLALDMKLHLVRPQGSVDIEDETKVGRRLWMSLCVMERLVSHSTGAPIKIAEDFFVFTRHDGQVIGEPLLYLARLASILGLMAQRNAHEGIAFAEAPFSYGLFPHRLLDFWEQEHPKTLYPPMNFPALHVLHLHIKLLVALDIKNTTPKTIQETAMSIMGFIVHANGLPGPLSIYFYGLLILVLVELFRHESTKHDGERSLTLLSEKNYIPAGWEPILRKMTDAIKPPVIEAATETSGSQNLQRLANVAIAETERGRDGGGENRVEGEQTTAPELTKQWSFDDYKDLRILARQGYLNVFSASQ